MHFCHLFCKNLSLLSDLELLIDMVKSEKVAALILFFCFSPLCHYYRGLTWTPYDCNLMSVYSQHEAPLR